MSKPLDIIGMMARLEPWFPGSSWDPWRAVLKAAFALPMTPSEIEFFRAVADRDPPKRRVRELWCATGRRSGKDSIASLIAAFAAVTFAQEAKLRPGERAVVLCLACDRDQSKIVLNYIRSYFSDTPALKAGVLRENADGISLNNGVDVTVATNSFRSTRGRTVLLAILDEVAFYRSETTATPDVETYRSLVPALATLQGSMLVAISSPYRSGGLLYDKVREHYGKDGDVLVIKAPTTALNPTIDPDIIERALAEDFQAARAEWLGEFRDDIAGYLDIALIEASVDAGVTVRPPRPGIAYTSFVDASGGVKDSFTAAVTHLEGNLVVLDCLLEIRAPFNPTAATEQVANTLRAYGLHSTTGDKYAAGWTVDAFAKCGIRYEHSERDRSAIYLDALPLFSAGRARLLDNRKVVTQFAALERRTTPVGRDQVRPGPAHDDCANSVAGALVLAVSNPAIDWGAGLAAVEAYARMCGRSSFSVMPGDPTFPHFWNGRHA